ncbi:MAG: HlyD family type I secretion periplasmic adaptor subunit [Pseudomonadota bacterium]
MDATETAARGATPADAERRPAGREARRFIRIGNLTIAALVGGGVAWSALAPMQEATIAPATLQVEHNRKAVQHPEGGVIGALLVTEGARVAEGDLLLRLDDTALRAELGRVEMRLFESLARRARLRAERDGLAEMAPPPALTARSEQPPIAEILTGQRTLFEARRSAREAAIALQRQRVLQLLAQIDGQAAQREARERELELLGEELRVVRRLRSKGLTTQARLAALQRREADLIGRHGAHAAAIAQSQRLIGEAEMRITALTVESRERVLSELREAQIEISDLTELRVAARDALARVEIRAPRSGRVLGLQAHTVGGVISPAAPIMEIVPEDERLIIAAEVRPQEVDRIGVGDVTRIRFPSLDQNLTPEIEGRIAKVSADALSKPDGTTYFAATVVFDPTALATALSGGAGAASGGADEAEAGVGAVAVDALRPGMPAEVFVLGETRSVLGYLAKPLLDAIAHAFRG